MKRGAARCVAQTINLSNPKTCARPKAQKFVSADSADSADLGRASDYWITRPVAVRICTRQDARRVCPQKIYDCPPKPLPLTSGEKLSRAFMYLVKSAITAGLIYWTYSEGLWSDSTKTEELYYRMMSTIAPALPGPPDDSIQLPHLEEIKYAILEAYNHALVKCMDIVVGVPLEVHRKLRDLLFPCDEIKETGATMPRRSDARRSTEI